MKDTLAEFQTLLNSLTEEDKQKILAKAKADSENDMLQDFSFFTNQTV